MFEYLPSLIDSLNNMQKVVFGHVGDAVQLLLVQAVKQTTITRVHLLLAFLAHLEHILVQEQPLLAHVWFIPFDVVLRL